MPVVSSSAISKRVMFASDGSMVTMVAPLRSVASIFASSGTV